MLQCPSFEVVGTNFQEDDIHVVVIESSNIGIFDLMPRFMDEAAVMLLNQHRHTQKGPVGAIPFGQKIVVWAERACMQIRSASTLKPKKGKVWMARSVNIRTLTQTRHKASQR